MSGGRVVRIAKGPAAASSAPLPDRSELSVWHPNRAGTQRAVRLTLLYVVFLAVLYGVFLGLDRTAPGGGSAGASAGLWGFSLVALVLGVGGALFALSQAPRGVEVGPTATVVVGRWGLRRAFPPVGQLAIREVRHHPAGILSSAPVVAVELTSSRGRRITCFLEQGILAPTTPPR